MVRSTGPNELIRSFCCFVSMLYRSPLHPQAFDSHFVHCAILCKNHDDLYALQALRPRQVQYIIVPQLLLPRLALPVLPGPASKAQVRTNL